jgi:hypothetical protein
MTEAGAFLIAATKLAALHAAVSHEEDEKTALLAKLPAKQRLSPMDLWEVADKLGVAMDGFEICALLECIGDGDVVPAASLVEHVLEAPVVATPTPTAAVPKAEVLSLDQPAAHLPPLPADMEVTGMDWTPAGDSALPAPPGGLEGAHMAEWYVRQARGAPFATASVEVAPMFEETQVRPAGVRPATPNLGIGSRDTAAAAAAVEARRNGKGAAGRPSTSHGAETMRTSIVHTDQLLHVASPRPSTATLAPYALTQTVGPMPGSGTNYMPPPPPTPPPAPLSAPYATLSTSELHALESGGLQPHRWRPQSSNLGPTFWSAPTPAAYEGEAAGRRPQTPRDRGTEPVPRDIDWTHGVAARHLSRRGEGTFRPKTAGNSISQITFG